MVEIINDNNLRVMRNIEPQSIHLICTMLPDFNSDNTLSEMNFEYDSVRDEVKMRGKTSSTYKALDNSLKGFDNILQNDHLGNKGSMRGYLAYLAPRFAEMYRILTPNGTLYCIGNSANHFVKCMFDCIFDQINKSENTFFRRDIILKSSELHNSDKWQEMWCNNHSSALYYVKDRPPTFNQPEKATSAIWDQNEKMYETMILVSSNEGETVLDPFCEDEVIVNTAILNERQAIGIK